MEDTLCNQCYKIFKSYKTQKKKFCSSDCYALFRTKYFPKNCIICDRLFNPTKNAKTCSSVCRVKYIAAYGLTKAENNGMWKGGRIKGSAGYIKILKPEHPYSVKSYVLEHRLIMENSIGRYLEPHEVVHHINHRKDDNRLENLQLLTKKEHDRLHCLENQKSGVFKRRKLEKPIPIKCTCGNIELRNYFRKTISCSGCKILKDKIRKERWYLKRAQLAKK